MATNSLPNPSEVLNLKLSGPNQCSILFPSEICFGEVVVGGFQAAAMTKFAVVYASQHPKISDQTDPRLSSARFFRPIFPSRGPVTMRIQEVSIGRAMSTLRVETFQGDMNKVCTTSDILLTKDSIKGLSVPTHWQLQPPPTPVNVRDLETHNDPKWACWHMAATNPRAIPRAFNFMRAHFPINRLANINYVEHWLEPGWDTTRTGGRDTSLPEARWTNELLEFVADIRLPVQQNFWAEEEGASAPHGSLRSSTIAALQQQKAREAGRHDWRAAAEDDGTGPFNAPFIDTTLSMSLEVKKKLPEDGVRWLYVRPAIKAVRDSWMDSEILIFDEAMDLVAIVSQLAQLIPARLKAERKANL